MNRTELANLYFLHSIKGIGNRTLWKIKRELGGFKNCFEADLDCLRRSSLSEAIVAKISDARLDSDPQLMLQQLAGNDINICCVEDDDYPDLLRSIFDPPYLFYYRGEISILNRLCISIVGSRAATNYGKAIARRFGSELAKQGITVVSGMARGIDTQAHFGALDAGGKTVAVMGSGLDIVYPPENRNLYERIGENGLLLSEFAPQTRPEPGNFPMRNRTIAGLSRGVVVVEARQKSGALITADFALEQGRDVFAIPGQINSKNSEGTNYLIQQGACLVTSIENILEECDFSRDENVSAIRQNEIQFDLDAEELAVLDALGHEQLHFDTLLVNTNLSIGLLSTLLLRMDLKGIIKSLPGNYYLKI